MTLPWDDRAAAEIELLTGLTVTRHVSITARLVVAIEKYYGILAPSRHRTLIAKLEGPVKAPSEKTPTPSEPSLHVLPALTMSSSSVRVPLVGDPPDPWDALSDPAGTIRDDELVLETVEPARNASPALDSPDLRTVLGHAEHRDEIGSAILDSLEARLRKVALFVVHGDRVAGWSP
jgi:hypothetical protein